MTTAERIYEAMIGGGGICLFLFLCWVAYKCISTVIREFEKAKDREDEG